jgi:glycosyltransferase involved in cell wall biosynthesis
MEKNKKLSIITINYNNRDGLRKTIESVVSQTYRDFEYVIIDGGSTDGSVEVIKEYADRIDYWVSERDKGIYNAMNKGAFAAHSEYLLFLNSGDALCEKNVLTVVFTHSFTADVVCGNIINDRGGSMEAPEEVTMEYFLLGCLPHPSSFVKRLLFDVHPYDERFKIAGDWEFFMYHLIVENVTYQHININVTLFDTTGISCSTNKDQHDAELRKEAIARILPPRVAEDFSVFMGKRDGYHRLFYTLSKSRMRKLVYLVCVLMIEILMLNRGWIRDYQIIETKES